MTRYWLRLALLTSPLLIWPLVELFVLPIDYFTFRPWEALITVAVPVDVLGPFYPDQHLIKWSIGSYDAYTRRPNPRRQYEEWFTDDNGLRNRPRAVEPERYDVVLWGDSNIVGAFNTQDGILSEQLERACSCTAYNAGSAPLPIRTRDGRFVDNPPKVVVINIPPFQDPVQLLHSGRFERISFGRLHHSPYPIWSLVLADRFMKQAGREWLRARLRVTELGRWVDYFAGVRAAATRNGEIAPAGLGHLAGAFHRMVERIEVKIGQLRGRPSPAPPSVPDAAPAPSSPPGSSAISEAIVAALEAAAIRQRDELRAAGIELVYLFDPHPDFPPYLPLAARLQADGVNVVYWETWPENFPDVYWNKEDSHWTERAIGDAALRIAQVLHDQALLASPRSVTTDHR